MDIPQNDERKMSERIVDLKMELTLFLLYVFIIRPAQISGQLSNVESLKTKSECDFKNKNVSIDCGSGAVIAPQKLVYGYRQNCSTSCCQYDPGDCLVPEDNREAYIRACSGQSLCNVPTQASRDFCAFGIVTASYVYVEYYCIPESRVISVCSTETINSTGEPLYLTSDGYPGVTVGELDCQCSFEISSCTSGTSYYVIDADLYLNVTSCDQSLKFEDESNITLGSINCESYYGGDLQEKTLQSNYLQITFLSETTSNREGLFFVGFIASEENGSFNINCTKEAPTGCIVDDGWLVWSLWTECSKTCGPGLQIRNRTCDNSNPSNGGSVCVGESTENRTCNEVDCPEDGGWSVWSVWSDCSQTCGSGMQIRNRTCDNPSPSNGGAGCGGESTENQTCIEIDCSVDGGWSAWTNWSECSLTCGSGWQTRNRTCDNPIPRDGGMDCPGESVDNRTCHIQNCSVDGGWSAWTNWSECSRTCGSGWQARNRTCDNPIPSDGGMGCLGENADNRTCHVQNCSVDGAWSPWTNWSECSRTCGSGWQTRNRTCDNPIPRDGGMDCPGESIDNTTCHAQNCSEYYGWSDWTMWSQCSHTCGPSIRTRERTCINDAVSEDTANDASSSASEDISNDASSSSVSEGASDGASSASFEADFCSGYNTETEYCDRERCPGLDETSITILQLTIAAGFFATASLLMVVIVIVFMIRF